MALSAPSPTHSAQATAVLIVCSHAPTRIGLGVLLRRQSWVRQCFVASTHPDAQVLAQRHRPGLALLDLSDDAPFGAAITTGLRQAHADLRIVVTARCERVDISSASIGADAYVLPGTSGEAIVQALHAAMSSDGRRAAPESPPARPHGLTARERDILLLLSTGATNHEIAAALHISAESVKKNATALYRKLGVRNRTQAAQRAAGLVGVST